MRNALFGLLLVAACSQPPDTALPAAPADTQADSAQADPQRAGDLVGSSWAMSDEPANTAPIITFTANNASGTTGCNQWSARYSRSEFGLSFEDLSVTERGCESGVMETEATFLQALRDTQGVRMEGEELVLFDIGGAENARFHRVS
jgi:heat shock protein HslJ